MAARKLTVTLPDGRTGVRRSPRPYTHVVAVLVEAPRRDHDRVEYRYSSCPEGQALEAGHQAEVDALPRNLGEGWRLAWDRLWKSWEPKWQAHKAACALGCDGHGAIRTEVSRTPEPTGWAVLSWHHSAELAHKAVGGRGAQGWDGVRVLEVDRPEAR